MPDTRLARYTDAIERVWKVDPDAARVIERHVSDLRRECARRRAEARDTRQQPTPTDQPGEARPSRTTTQRRTRP